MKKRSICIIIVFLIIISLVIYFMYPKKEYQNNNANLGNMAIMLEDSADSNTYSESVNGEFPETGYSYNAEKSYCLNGSTLTWDNTNKKISVTISGSEKCYVYFDVKPPTLAEAVLANNGGVATIEAKGTPDFNQMSPAITTLTDDNFSGNGYTYSATPGNYYTYSDSYSFNSVTGRYTLINPKVCLYSSCYSELANKYVISEYGSTDSSIVNYTDLYMISKLTLVTSTNFVSTRSTYTNHHDMNDKGMYMTQDDYGKSYYFRGAVDNNWVYFAGFYWRIIRVNGDGSVKLIYSGLTAPTESENVLMFGSKVRIGTSTFNESSKDNMYVGYMYTSGEVHGISTNSTIKTFIDDWFSKKILNYSSYLADEIFCSDRTPYTDAVGSVPGGGTGTTPTYYETFVKEHSYKSPTLPCPNKLDSFTVNDTVKGNGALTYPVGLLTYDEAIFAGFAGFGSSKPGNKGNFLYSYDYVWLFSPVQYHSAGSLGIEISYSHISDAWSIQPHSVRPVISLKSDVQVTGSGLWNDPYLVQ